MSADLRTYVIVIASLAEEAGVSGDELASISLVEFAVRLMMARQAASAKFSIAAIREIPVLDSFLGLKVVRSFDLHVEKN